MGLKKSRIAAATFVLLVIAGLIYLYFVKAALYPYKVDQDYRYSFTDKNSTAYSIDIQDQSFSFPALTPETHTLFLKVRLQTGPLGRFLYPQLNIQSPAGQTTEYLEHGGSGIRYLNLSHHHSASGGTISFNGMGVAVPDQAAELYAMPNPIKGARKLLVISPHPDDAEIAAFGLYRSFDSPFITTITIGDAGEQKYDELISERDWHFETQARLRTWNSITVPLLAGVPIENSINLGYFDTRLRTMYRMPQEQVTARYAPQLRIDEFQQMNQSDFKTELIPRANWVSLVKNLEKVLQKVRPDVIVTPYPRLDSNHDHKQSTVALVEALKNLNIRDGYILMYSNHYTKNERYPYGARGGLHSLAPSFDDSVYFESLYSHNMDEKDQLEKLFALESMNVIRQDLEWLFVKGASKHALRVMHQAVHETHNSYLRRGVRANEMFYGVAINSLYDERVLKSLYGKI